MATVRLSQVLINVILDTAGKTQERAVTRAKDSRPSNDWAEKIYNTLLGDEIALVEKVPEHWFSTITEFELQSVAGVDCRGMKFTFAAPKRWPKKIVGDLGKLYYDGSNAVILSSNILWGELHAEVAAWNARVYAAQNKKQEFLSSIRTILNSYSTLAPALKAWPPLWDYIPDDVKAKHKEIPTKEKKAEVLLAVDLSTLTSMAVAAKIG